MSRFLLSVLVWLAGPWAVAAQYVNRFPQLVTPPDYNVLPAVGGQAAAQQVLGSITGFEQVDPRIYSIACGDDRLRVEFYRTDVVRVWLAWGGTNFTDPATADIVVGQPDANLRTSWRDAGDFYEMGTNQSGGIVLRAAKGPMKLSMHRDGLQLWAEQDGLTQNATATFQTLAAADGELFYGGGMQNGRWSHKGHKIAIAVSYQWEDGGSPNAAPVYLSSQGYGVYRNTWNPGYYDFIESNVVLAHNESRFDAFYFAAAPRDFKGLLKGYTYLTGRPFMPPVYGLGLGDSDCYHDVRHGNSTYVATAVAEKYEEMDMPEAWMLINDGYGCGFGKGPEKFPSNFTVLDEVVASLKESKFVTGLWSSTGLPNISREVNGSGIRVGKTDVGWIGAGYKYAFDAVKMVAAGIEDNSDARRFIWTVEGWAGTHRLAVMWTGDDTGNFDYIRWQIPTFIGSGFSAQAHVSGDIDGIFGGSPETYTRDLQFKCFTTTIMSMSGWAANPDKQPWTWGEPYTSINRMYLKIKRRLTPYFYSLSRVAYDEGVPPIRALAMEFPEDPSAFEVSVGTTYSFMAGPSLLVAPVYTALATSEVRDGIYLPPGAWVDYWTGKVEEGNRTINGYKVPLDKLPVFVRAGAIIPMWPEKPIRGPQATDVLTLDIYPHGESSFALYEDDGVTRQALEKSQFAWTNLSCSAPMQGAFVAGPTTVSVGASVGSFDGKPSTRAYRILLHVDAVSHSIELHGPGGVEALPEALSLSALDFLGRGWYFVKPNVVTEGGVLHILTGSVSTAEEVDVKLVPLPSRARSPLTLFIRNLYMPRELQRSNFLV